MEDDCDGDGGPKDVDKARHGRVGEGNDANKVPRVEPGSAALSFMLNVFDFWMRDLGVDAGNVRHVRVVVVMFFLNRLGSRELLGFLILDLDRAVAIAGQRPLFHGRGRGIA